jgi:hypothetical protein
MRDFSPATMARCMLENHGTLKITESLHEGAVRYPNVVVLLERGNRPGGLAGNLVIAASSTPYPLTLVTGPRRAGGHVDVCNDGKPNPEQWQEYLSRFDRVPALQAPLDPLRVGAQSVIV